MNPMAGRPRSDGATAREASLDAWLAETASDPVVLAIMHTQAFRRLHDVSFLGALDYTHRLFLPKAQRSRAAHSLHVAALANYVACGRDYPPALRQQLVIAALLHDIGHPPLSHSAEAALRARTGYDHHEAGARIIRGEVRIGRELNALLQSVADVPFLLNLLEQNIGGTTGGDLFVSRMNIDTFDGIARSLDCLAPGLPPLCRLSTARAALLDSQHDAQALATLDEFWERKNLVYTQFIRQPLGILADQASRQFFAGAQGGQAIAEEDFYAGETLWQHKYPRLFEGFAQLQRHQLPAWLSDEDFEIEFRGYFVDGEQDFSQRYRLIRGHQQTQASALLAKLEPHERPQRARNPAYRDFLHDYPHIARARQHSAAVVQRIRADLHAHLDASPCRERLCVVATGSYGRDEACADSDLDWFILLDGCAATDVLAEKAQTRQVIGRHIAREPGDSGLFGSEATQDFAPLVEHIGGSQDSNRSLTRRMLLLLEGRSLYGDEHFARLRRRLLEAYIGKGSRDKAISRFLLNDVIRCYRTIATDVQHKASVDRRDWGLRSIKLKFSRKLLYFAGIVAIAETAGETAQDARIERLLALLELPALERIQAVASAEPASDRLRAKTREIFAIYEFFLRQISEPANRRELAALREEHREDSDLYMELRASSKAFSRTLFDWLREKYAEEHPIHNALVF
ncbi:HD domain-containing protein [Pseudomonas sp. MAP12]|uniref:HD domain-containing protein n=1 Tax=Geopseudomonas aromaticivorans TaxID=2849492 RepID=A0ABS6N0X6_9GAMM|nr:HD domain-containing protein [Pseudomonas aromaticivorans]MBV2134314.1 HD domain-containing protein [Pseudomonas aromaticivorans]